MQKPTKPRAPSTSLFITMTRREQDRAAHWIERAYPYSRPDERVRYGVYERVKADAPISLAWIRELEQGPRRRKVTPTDIGQLSWLR